MNQLWRIVRRKFVIFSPGIAELPIILGLALMAIALPVASRLVQQNQNTENLAVTYTRCCPGSCSAASCFSISNGGCPGGTVSCGTTYVPDPTTPPSPRPTTPPGVPTNPPQPTSPPCSTTCDTWNVCSGTPVINGCGSLCGYGTKNCSPTTTCTCDPNTNASFCSGQSYTNSCGKPCTGTRNCTQPTTPPNQPTNTPGVFYPTSTPLPLPQATATKTPIEVKTCGSSPLGAKQCNSTPGGFNSCTCIATMDGVCIAADWRSANCGAGMTCTGSGSCTATPTSIPTISGSSQCQIGSSTLKVGQSICMSNVLYSCENSVNITGQTDLRTYTCPFGCVQNTTQCNSGNSPTPAPVCPSLSASSCVGIKQGLQGNCGAGYVCNTYNITGLCGCVPVPMSPTPTATVAPSSSCGTGSDLGCVFSKSGDPCFMAVSGWGSCTKYTTGAGCYCKPSVAATLTPTQTPSCTVTVNGTSVTGMCTQNCSSPKLSISSGTCSTASAGVCCVSNPTNPTPTPTSVVLSGSCSSLTCSGNFPIKEQIPGTSNCRCVSTSTPTATPTSGSTSYTCGTVYSTDRCVSSVTGCTQIGMTSGGSGTCGSGQTCCKGVYCNAQMVRDIGCGTGSASIGGAATGNGCDPNMRAQVWRDVSCQEKTVCVGSLECGSSFYPTLNPTAYPTQQQCNAQFIRQVGGCGYASGAIQCLSTQLAQEWKTSTCDTKVVCVSSAECNGSFYPTNTPVSCESFAGNVCKTGISYCSEAGMSAGNGTGTTCSNGGICCRANVTGASPTPTVVYNGGPTPTKIPGTTDCGSPNVCKSGSDCSKYGLDGVGTQTCPNLNSQPQVCCRATALPTAQPTVSGAPPVVTGGGGGGTGTGSCTNSTLQARVQPNAQTAWTQQLSVNQGQTVSLLCGYNGTGHFADATKVNIYVKHSDGTETVLSGQSLVNGWVAPKSGNYTVYCKETTANCSLTSDTATLTVAGSTQIACKECPSDFKCYGSATYGQYKWFVPGYVPATFELSVDQYCLDDGLAKPSWIGKKSGDATCDGRVNGEDYSLWLREYLDVSKAQKVSRTTWEADFTGPNGVCDGIVDGNDYSLWLRNYLK